jgi:hypothetical protein
MIWRLTIAIAILQRFEIALHQEFVHTYPSPYGYGYALSEADTRAKLIDPAHTRP